MLNVCIGYDKHEAVAFHVLAHSILRRASKPVCITPLYLPWLESSGIYKRERSPNQSTDFTFTRFLTPWLSGSQRSIFMDCDMLCLADIFELEKMVHGMMCDVAVVKHNYEPNPDPKFLGQKQTLYPCKNWSSLMVFNGYRQAVRNLTPTYINRASAMDLHQFRWCGEHGVGALPLEWNHLVGEYAPNNNAKLVHFTRGGPWFPDYADCEYADLWREELAHATSAG